MKLLDIFGISQESLQFQTNNNFGKELENVFDVIAKTPFSEVAEIYAQFKIFDAIIFKYTGLNTKFQHASDTVGATSVLQINVNNVLLDPNVKAFFKKNLDIAAHSADILKQANETKKKHTVNLKNSKVTGIFSEIQSPIYININLYKNWNITAGQMTAILLHEIGHIFSYFEFLSRQVTTNQILAAVAKSVMNKDTIQQREFIFKEALDILDAKVDNVTELANQNDLKIVTAVCIKASIDQLQSEMGISNYDFSSSEMLADQYVTRQGYGRENIEIHDIFGKMFGDYEKYQTARIFMNFSQIFTIIVTTAGGAFLGVVGSPVFILISGLALGLLVGTGGGEINKTRKYDDLRVRFLRIREDTVNYLKSKDLEPAYVKKALEDLAIMDKIIKDTAEARFVYDIIMDFINPKSRAIRNSMELQRNLEELAMNDFFIKSATLATI